MDNNYQNNFLKEKTLENLCIWKLSLNNEETSKIPEGRLRHCKLYCDGYQFNCYAYEPSSILKQNKEKQNDNQ